MKIVFSVKAIYPFHSYGGIEKYIFNLAKHLAARGVDVEIVAPSYKKGVEKDLLEGVRFTFLPPKISYFSDFSLGRVCEHIFGIALYRYLSGKEFDLLHGIELTPYIYMHKKNRKKVIFHLFYDTYRKKPHKDKYYYAKYPFIKLLKTNAVKYCIKNADGILTETPRQTQELVKLFNISGSNIFDIPVGVDLKGINSAVQKNKKISREKIGIKPGDFVAISVNRLVPEKGIEYLVDALKILGGRIPNIKVILIGAGYQEKKIIHMVKEYGLSDKFIHLKNVEEGVLYSYYSISDVYVSPTLQEDFIMGIQEAMACGLPVVSTGQDWLVHDGINGYFAGRRDPRQLAEKIYKIYSDKTGIEMGKKSLEIIKPYDYNAVAENLIRIYGNTITGKL